MAGARSFCILVACGAFLALAACSRTSDGSIIADGSIPFPNMNIPSIDPIVPSWMRRQPQPEPVARNFPPPPQAEQRRRTTRTPKPPVVRSSSGNLTCQNKTEGVRVRVVCE